jgi:carbamoyltransferase
LKHGHRYILGISAYYHDSAAALLCDGRIVAAAQEERFSRKKHDPGFPSRAVLHVLEEAGIGLDALSGIAFYEKPFIKFERLLETYHAVAPAGLPGFLASIPVWIKEKLFMRKMLHDGLDEIFPATPHPPLFFPEHHLSHAASAFFPSPFTSAAILTIDGVGEWTTTAIAHGRGNSIAVTRELHFPHSLGLLYSAFTAYCGFKVNSGEYKLMGLAPYGRPDSERVCRFEDAIRSELVDIRADGSFLLNTGYFSFLTGLRMYHAPRWERLFSLPPRAPESPTPEQDYMDMALAIQRVTEDIVLRLAKTARERTGEKALCLAGGVALNCVANGRLLRSGIFDRLWIQPASGDAGGALGAALALWHIGMGNERKPDGATDAMRGAFLGPEFGRDEIFRMCGKYRAPHEEIASEEALCDRVADLLAEGRVIGWFQGKMEYGPRALGNRSILADPRDAEMQRRLNLKIKYREGFRPFAPSVPEEYAGKYFALDSPSPYMLLTAPVTESIRKPLPEKYWTLSLRERLYHVRSTLPAITHVNYSARLQTVNKDVNPRYWLLLESFRKKTGCPVLVNTSFNVRGEPVVCTPEDAYRCFMRTEMDCLVLGNALLFKDAQPAVGEEKNWREEHVLD